MGTWSSGLFRYDPRTEEVTHFHDTLSGAQHLPWRGTLCGMPSSEGDMWIGLNRGAGACRFEKGEAPPLRYFNQSDGAVPGYGVVQCLAQAEDGAIWAGTNEGGSYG